jgi:hypothetical protein
VTIQQPLALPALEVPPDPAALIESMRAFGYSLPAAVADLIDNSISAHARTISVEFDWSGRDSTLAIVDDGHGMDEHALREAMRLGSRSPVEQRAISDLGRFGLGLKSAAWSQARSLTVISRAPRGPVLTRRWDLDYVTATKKWLLLPSGSRMADEMAGRLESFDHGTIVLLERLDRVTSDVEVDDDRARERFLAARSATAVHLSMVFHRFLAGRHAISLEINGTPLEPWDPFLEEHPATQRLPAEDLPLGEGKVRVAPFVLPHVSKLTTEAHTMAAGPSGWNAGQGFYVYRARRLIVSGDWLGLRRMQQEEHYKLARIRVDLDNAMDEEWQIDVRKATARIPGALQPEFTRIAQTTRRRAADAYRFRGKRIARDSKHLKSISFVWERVSHRNGAHTFRLNRKHPVLAMLVDAEQGHHVEQAMRLAEENLPVEAIVMDSRESPDADRSEPFAARGSELLELLTQTHLAMVGAGTSPAVALGALATIEPFNAHPEILEAYRETLDT